MNVGTQTIAGNKTFSGATTFSGGIAGATSFSSPITITPVTNQIVLGTTNTTTISATAPASSSIYTIADVGATAAFVMTAGNQTIAGTKTFSGTIVGGLIEAQGASGEFRLNGATSGGISIIAASVGTHYAILTNAAIATADRTYTIPDAGNNANFLLSEGTKTINGDTVFNGTMTRPNQPSFLVITSATATNATGDGTSYTVAWGTEVYDQGNNFSSNTFTAPVAGKYLLCLNLMTSGNLVGHTVSSVAIVTTNRSYTTENQNLTIGERSFNVMVIADMSAGHTAYVTVQVSGATKVVGVYSQPYTSFSGSLIN